MALAARDVMQAEVRTVRPDMPLVELEEVLLRHHIGGAPVVQEGAVVGIVSRSDLVKHLQVEQSQAEALSAYYLDPWDADRITERDRERVADAVASRWQDARVEDVMSRDLIQVAPDASLDRVARLLLERRVHRVLVMDGTRLAGILSATDLIRLVAERRLAARS